MLFSRRLGQGLILAVALGVTLVLVMGVWRGKVQKEQLAVPTGEPPEAEMKLTDMEYTEMQEGRRFWTLKATEAKYFQDEQKTLLTAVRLTFFLEGGDEIHLESQEGILYAGTKNIELWNAVRATLPRGYELSTERAFYEHQKKTIQSETPVQLNGSDVQLQGNRWVYWIPEHRAVLEGGVRASLVLLPPKKKSK